MADKKISQLTALSAANLAPSTDVLAIVDTSATETKKIVAQDLINGVLNVASAVGIGTASPAYKLDVNNGGGSIAGFRVSGNDQANVRMRLENSGSGGRTWELVGGLPGSNNANFSIRDVTGSTTPLTIDSSGNFGIGTTSPASKLHVDGGSIAPTSGQVARFDTSATTAYNGAAFVGGTLRLNYGNATSSYGGINFSNFGATNQDFFGVVQNSSGYGDFVWQGFNGSYGERMRLTSGGDLLVGTTTSGGKLSVVGTNVSSPLGYYRDEGTPTGNMFVISSNAYGSSFVVNSSGNVLSPTVYSATVGGTNRDVYVDNTGLIGYVSSVRASKTNITPIANTDWLLQLNPVTFNYRKKDEDGNYTDEADGPIKHGLIAEEVEEVNADLCFYDDENKGGALRGVNYSHLITPMLKLIQQQQAAIAALEAKVAALESA